MRAKAREILTVSRRTWPDTATATWILFFSIVLSAIILRFVFFPSGFGSDEVVYSEVALRILHGEWTRNVYIGALRYGINVPLALWMSLFGYGNWGLGGLYFACSVAEVILAFFFARHLWGEHAALWSALIVAVLPLNVSLAGSLNPDLYLALIIELSFVTFYFAQRNNSYRFYFLAGLLAGWVFWIKEVVIIYGVAFFLLEGLERRWGKGWLWFILGGTICVLGNLALFWKLYGDPLYQFHIVNTAVSNSYVSRNIADTSLGTYLVYLFVRIYHTGLLGWLALAGCIAALRRPVDRDMRFVLIWACALFFVFSALPISLSPLKFIGKQSNYMVIFLFPFALLAGWFLSQQRMITQIVLGTVVIASGIILSAMEQQVVRTVAANGPSAIDFADRQGNVPVFGSDTLVRLSELNRVLQGSLDNNKDIRMFEDLKELAPSKGASGEVVAYAVADPQASHFSRTRDRAAITVAIQTCGRLVEHFAPPEDLGLGRPVVGALYNTAKLLPAPIAIPLRQQLEPMYHIEPATAYALTRACVQEITSSG